MPVASAVLAVAVGWELGLVVPKEAQIIVDGLKVEISVLVDHLWFVVLLRFFIIMCFLMVSGEVVLKVERSISTEVRSSAFKLFDLCLWNLRSRDWVHNDWDEVLLWMGLVPFLGSVWVVQVVVVEFWHVVKVEVPVVVAWTSEVVLNIEVIPLVLKTEGVFVIVSFLWLLVLGWNVALESGPLDGGGHLVGVCLFLWVVDRDVIVTKLSSFVIVVVAVVPEVLVLVDWDAVWVKTPIPVEVAGTTMLVELSVGTVSKLSSDLFIEVIKNVVEVSLEGAASLHGRHPLEVANFLIKVGKDIISMVNKLEWV